MAGFRDLSHRFVKSGVVCAGTVLQWSARCPRTAAWRTGRCLRWTPWSTWWTSLVANSTIVPATATAVSLTVGPSMRTRGLYNRPVPPDHPAHPAHPFHLLLLLPLVLPLRSTRQLPTLLPHHPRPQRLQVRHVPYPLDPHLTPLLSTLTTLWPVTAHHPATLSTSVARQVVARCPPARSGLVTRGQGPVLCTFLLLPMGTHPVSPPDLWMSVSSLQEPSSLD